MISKLTDCFKYLRLIPVPSGEYQRNNPDNPPFMVNFRLPDLSRTLPIEFKNKKQRLFVNREIICNLSKLCADEVESLEKSGQELVVRLPNVERDDMERLLFAICPTIYGQYPIPPTIFDVSMICPVACFLQIDIVIKMCEEVLEYDIHSELTPTDLLLSLFNMAYKFQLKETVQAKLFTKVLECDYWKLKYSLICKVESPFLRIFLWNFREMRRNGTCSKKAHNEDCYVRYGKFWVSESLDASTEEMLRLCIFNELLFSHTTITAQTKIYKSSCNQCEENAVRIAFAEGHSVGAVPNKPKKLFLCQQCNRALCLNCEAKFCFAKLVEFLRDVHKAEGSKDMLEKLRIFFTLNSSNNDAVRSLVNIH